MWWRGGGLRAASDDEWPVMVGMVNEGGKK
jgi:hypothetical protein